MPVLIDELEQLGAAIADARKQGAPDGAHMQMPIGMLENVVKFARESAANQVARLPLAQAAADDWRDAAVLLAQSVLSARRGNLSAPSEFVAMSQRILKLAGVGEAGAMTCALCARHVVAEGESYDMPGGKEAVVRSAFVQFAEAGDWFEADVATGDPANVRPRSDQWSDPEHVELARRLAIAESKIEQLDDGLAVLFNDHHQEE